MPLSLAITALGACSLLNAPEDVRSGGGVVDGGACAAASDCPPPPSGETCRVAVCTEAHECTIEVASDGMGCDDGEPCTTGEVCTKGVCTGGMPTNCSMNDTECSKGKCIQGIGCDREAVNGGLPCDMMNPCADSTCKAGKCVVDTPHPGVVCDDGLFCTAGDACDDSGKCASTQPQCTTSVACTEAVCDEAAKMCSTTPIADGQPCEDGDACTGGETCASNMCSGGSAVQGFFSEGFASNAKGWVLGNEWQIGPAKVSMGEETGNPDPAQDHTGTTDNGIAGVVIGGDASITPHPMAYLESPAIDVTKATGKLFLTYYRWLNTDYIPYMLNVVEVNDGTMWHEVWRGAEDPGITDAAWTFVSHDITQFKNAALKFRFGVAVTADMMTGDALLSSSWNLDDVKLQNTPCPK